MRIARAHILGEIRRTAASNGGKALGKDRFAEETGIRYTDWFGVYWTKWGDAVSEAGVERNELNRPFDKRHLLRKYAELVRELGRLPVKGDLKIKRKNDPNFPSSNTFDRLGTKAKIIQQLEEFCRTESGFGGVMAVYAAPPRLAEAGVDEPTENLTIGYVYLLKHGTRREYKIGRTYNALRREGEIGIELPEKAIPVHVIKTDDPPGIEGYWHKRFAAKRKNGEWFELNAGDVAAFRRRKFM